MLKAVFLRPGTLSVNETQMQVTDLERVAEGTVRRKTYRRWTLSPA